MWVVQRFRAGFWQMDEFHNTICPLGTFLSTHWQLNFSFHMPWGHWSAPSFELSVLLDQCEGLTFLLPWQWPSSQAPQKVSKEGPWLSYIPPLQLLPLAVLFPSNSACSMMPVCVMGIPSPQPPMSNLSFRSSIFSLLICHLGRDNTPMLLRRAKWGRGGTNCLPAKQEHKTGAAIAVREHIKAIISLPVHSQETKPLQSPAGNHPRQRHLHGTSPQGCRAEGMICLYSAIKALILSFLFPSCGSQ